MGKSITDPYAFFMKAITNPANKPWHFKTLRGWLGRVTCFNADQRFTLSVALMDAEGRPASHELSP